MTTPITPIQAMRPGSEDYKKVPSLSNGQRIPYRPPVNVTGERRIAPVGFAK